MKKIFLDNLPKRSNGNILWKKCIGQEIHFIYEEIDDKFLVLDYIRKENKYILKIEYRDRIIETYITNILSCNIGKIIKYKKKHNYLYKVGDKIIDEKRNITIIGYKNKEITRKDNRTEIKYGYSFTCGICGWEEGWISEKELGKNGGCSCCSSKVVVKGINDITTTAQWMVPYFQGGENEASLYTKCSSTKLIFKCPRCGKLSNRKRPIYDIYTGHGFPCVCSDSLSILSKYVRTLLDQFQEQNQIQSYYTEQKFEWCQYFNPYKNKICFGIYDFVIEEKKLIIETDGGFHRSNNIMSGQTKEESQFIDKSKDKLAMENGYTIVRISDEIDIKESIQNSQLIYIFDFNYIDWEKCEIGSSSSFLLKACKMKSQNPELTVKEISEAMNFGLTTIRRWLNYGTKHRLCVYDAEYERQRSIFTYDHKVSSEKEIICINNGMTFTSGVDLCNRSESIFKHKFSKSNISSCCNRKTNDINGYIFRFSKDLNENEKKQLNANMREIKLKKVNNEIIEEFENFISLNKIKDKKLIQLYNERHNCLNVV